MPKKLKKGSIVPVFSAKDVYGKLINQNYSRDKYRLVVFMRYAGCPWCNLAIHRLVLEYKLLIDNDCSVIVFVQSSKENIVKNIFDRHEKKPQFPIIADSDMNIYRAFGIKPSLSYSAKMIKNIPHWVHSVKKGGYGQENVDGSLFLAPAAFLITPYKAQIIRADYSVDMFKHESFSLIYEAIAIHKLNR